MESDNDHKLESFTQEEYFDLKKEQRQIRLLALGIMGAVLAFLFRDPERLKFGENDIDNLMRVALSGISFVFAMLAVHFVRLSRRYDEVTGYLKRQRPDEYKEFFGGSRDDPPSFKNSASVSQAAPLTDSPPLNWVTRAFAFLRTSPYDYNSTFSNSIVFLLPLFVALSSALFFFPSRWQGYAIFIFTSFLVSDLIILRSLVMLWLSGPKGKYAWQALSGDRPNVP